MEHKEALEWLRGERSMCNLVPQDPHETWQERIARADAAMTERAYWIARAYKENIVGAQADESAKDCDEHCSMCSGEYCATHFHQPCDCDTAERHYADESLWLSDDVNDESAEEVDDG